MKKWISLLLTLTILLCSLCACKEDEEDYSNLNAAATCVAVFKKLVKDNPDASAEKIGNLYAKHSTLSQMNLEVYSEEYPTDYAPFIYGLSEDYEIPEYESVTHITPPFFPNKYVSHIFVLKEGTDAKAFCKELTDHADLAFNVCMVSDECDAGYVGNMVFFVICGSDLWK